MTDDQKPKPIIELAYEPTPTLDLEPRLTCSKCGHPYAFSHDHNYFCLNDQCPVISPSFPLFDFVRKMANITDKRIEYDLQKIIKLFKALARMNLALKKQIDLEGELRIYHQSAEKAQHDFDELQDQISRLTGVMIEIQKAVTKAQDNIVILQRGTSYVGTTKSKSKPTAKPVRA